VVPPEAEQALKREAVLEAVAAAEGIESTDEEHAEALQIPPGHEGQRTSRARRTLRGDTARDRREGSYSMGLECGGRWS